MARENALKTLHQATFFKIIFAVNSKRNRSELETFPVAHTAGS